MLHRLCAVGLCASNIIPAPTISGWGEDRAVGKGVVGGSVLSTNGGAGGVDGKGGIKFALFCIEFGKREQI